MMRQFQETPRCVVIRHLQPTVALSRYLRDFVEALSSALFQARDGHLECDRITAIYQEPDSVVRGFCLPFLLHSCLRVFCCCQC